MWEVFLFVNPLGSYCLNTETTILNFVDDHNIQAHFNFIAVNNLKNITDFMNRTNMDTSDLQLRNEITLSCYDAALTYKAASCQGQKKARQLLMKIQYAINELNAEYNEDLIKNSAKELHIDYEELLADKECDLINSSFEADQLLAQEMNVTQTPSTVIFNYDSDDQNGILIDNHSKEDLENILFDLYKNNQPQKNNTKNNLIDISFYQK
ncbi:DsbA family protein [Companilactobacillus sp. DQM5]|uniref:DsbA family protein n=1 Tax=Companilactobacillus sp. DQM5 TaxID=3463359 RepID=UPI00405954BD